MRRPLLLTAVVLAGTVSAACRDDRAPLSAPLTPGAALLSTTPTISDLRTQSDALLQEPARTAARYALSKLQYDITYKRSTIYASSLAFAAIPLVERRFNRIPEARIAELLSLLCKLSQIIEPYLPPTFPRIPWCSINPDQVSDEATFKLVLNSVGATVASQSEQLTLAIEAGSMQDAQGNPVSAAFFSVIPLQRRITSEVTIAVTPSGHECPTVVADWDPAFASSDCYPEFYELNSQPAVQFSPVAHLEICQLDPSSGSPDAPSQEVASRLRLFSKDGQNRVSLLANSGPGGSATACDGDGDLHTASAIGPVNFSKHGLRNAWLTLARSGERVLGLFRPTPLYAGNSPTHGDLGVELLGLGNVFGAIDPRVVDIGIAAPGNLIVGDAPPSGQTQTPYLGLRLARTNYDGVSPGCLCEGWGVADAGAGVSGWAYGGGATSENLTVNSFTKVGDRTTSVVTISSTFRVTHDFRPSPKTSALYEVDVTIENISSASVGDLRYRRVVDWDVEPTAFDEFVTIHKPGTAASLLYSSNDGFAQPDPLAPRTSLGFTGEFTDAGPADHGALFDFGFGSLAAGASRRFKLYYGAAGNEVSALAAVNAVGAEVYSLGQPSSDGLTGTPNTFMLAFTGVNVPPGVTPVTSFAPSASFSLSADEQPGLTRGRNPRNQP